MANIITLLEFDSPKDIYPISYNESGIPFYQCTPTAHTVTDDYGIVGYYSDTNTDIYNVKSLKVVGVSFSATTSYADMLATDDSFYYDGSNKIYFHRAGWEPVLGDSVFIGATSGYSKGSDHPYYGQGNTFYPPLLESVPAIKQSIDPLYFGLLKYQSVSPSLGNLPVPPLIAGEFDDWRTRNLYNQAIRLMWNDVDNTYANFTNLISGYIEDDSTDFGKFSVKIQDLRKGLTQQVCINKYTQAEYPRLDSSDVDKYKPYIHNYAKHAKTVCLNRQDEATASSFQFHFIDTTYRSAPSGSYAVYSCIDGKYKQITTGLTFDLINGYVSILRANCVVDDSLVDIVVSIDWDDWDDGDDILLYLMNIRDGKPYNASFWNTTEINELPSIRSTSLYIDDTTALSKAIENICFDCDLRFFVQKDGRYTIRVYTASRTIDATIPTYDWLEDPKIKNNGSDYLTSCVVKYDKDINEDKFTSYDSSDLGTYRSDAFKKYKTYKSKEYESGLIYSGSAIAKATTIMDWSYNIQDIITRTFPLKIYDVNGSIITDYSDLEICDFIYCSPNTRIGQADVMGVYEILSTSINIDKMTQELEFRYVRAS